MSNTQIENNTGYRSRPGWGFYTWLICIICQRGRAISSTMTFSARLFLAFLCSVSSLIAATSIPQLFQLTNLLRTIDLTKPYVRDSTALVLENISNSTQTHFLWAIPRETAPHLSYLEAKEKKPGASTLFPVVELAEQDHSFCSSYMRNWPF